MIPEILKDFDHRWYFTKEPLTTTQKLKTEIARVYFTSASEADVTDTSTEALKELSKIEKRKTVLSKIRGELKKRAKKATEETEK
jgi:hypothetical protein